MRDFSGTVVFRWLAAGDASEFDRFDELLHPDAVIHAPAGLSTTSAEEEKAVWREAAAEAGGIHRRPSTITITANTTKAFRPAS